MPRSASKSSTFAQAQGEPEVEPDRVLNNLWWVSMPFARMA
jgi:hypothetical protein